MIDRQMAAFTRRHPRIQVSTDGDAGPYVLVGHEQVARVAELLTENGHIHLVDRNTTHFAVVELGKDADVQAIQQLLDNEP